MRLNIEILQNDLNNMHELKGFTYSEITKESGVHNISRIISGDICPTVDSWWRLRKAFPDHIQEPVYSSGEKIYSAQMNANNAEQVNQTQGNLTLNKGYQQTPQSSLTAKEQTLIDLIRQYDENDKYLNKLIMNLIAEFES